MHLGSFDKDNPFSFVNRSGCQDGNFMEIVQYMQREPQQMRGGLQNILALLHKILEQGFSNNTTTLVEAALQLVKKKLQKKI